MMNEIQGQENEPENPYLILDFWHFAILSTLMVVFFPWSLLFCVLVFGLEQTKLICLALVHDAFKTFLAVASLVFVLVFIIFIIFVIFSF